MARISYDELGAVEVVENYLDQRLYPRLASALNCEYQRNYHAETQKQGIDVTLGSLLIDEKAAISHANKKLDTFAFELSTKTRKYGRVKGWFIKKDNLTTTYNLVYLDTVHGTLGKGGHIKKAHCLIISKKDLMNHLSSHYGLSKKRLNNLSYQAFRSSSGRIALADGIRIVHSRSLAESPVNIVIPRSVLFDAGAVKVEV